jgi:3-methylcrotonyl-CoA carboxylase alpha subunit
MTRDFVLNGQRLQVRYEKNETGTVVSLDGMRGEYSIEELDGGRLLIQNGSRQHRARVVRDKDRVLVWLEGRVLELQIPSDEGDGAGAHGKSDRAVRAPMPGTLIKLHVAAGDAVEEGQILAVVEAMKMEHALRAPHAGVVESVSGAQGSIVDGGAVIVLLAEQE